MLATLSYLTASSLLEDFPAGSNIRSVLPIIKSRMKTNLMACVNELLEQFSLRGCPYVISRIE
jgi:hypothetical protein